MAGLFDDLPDDKKRFPVGNAFADLPTANPQAAPTSNLGAGVISRILGLTGDFIEGTARIGEQGGDWLESRIPLSGLTPEQLNQRQLEPLFRAAEWLKRQQQDINYHPTVDFAQVKEAPLNLPQTGKFILEQGVTSLPDMAASVLNLPGYVLSRTNNIADERATNEGRTDAVTLGDMAKAAPAALVEATLERLATKALPPGVVQGASAPARIAKQVGLQAGTEAIEETAAYAGESAGTRAGFQGAEALDRAAAGALVGGAIGGTTQGAGEAYDATIGSPERQLARAIEQRAQEIADTRPDPNAIRNLFADLPPAPQRVQNTPPAAQVESKAEAPKPAPQPPALGYDPQVSNPQQVMAADANGNVRPMSQDEQLAAQAEAQRMRNLGLTPDVQRAAAQRAQSEVTGQAPGSQDLIQRLLGAGWTPPATTEAAPAVSPEAPVDGAKQPILQNRNRSTPSSIAQMQSIAAQPDYGRLGFSRDFANGAPVVAGGQVAPEQMGRQDVAVASDGRRIPVQYAVVEAADVLPSNRADGTPNADYGNQAVQRIRAIAGNGRIAGLQQAYRKGTTAGYINELSSDTLHGVSPDVIRRMRAPVLVRVMPADQVTADIGDVSNTVGNLNLSAVEQANNDAQRVNLDALQFAEDGSITPEAVRQFVRAMPQAEQGGLIDTNGQPTKQAVDRINAAVFARAYGNDQLIRLFAQAQDPEARNVLSALAQVAPKMARLEGAGALDIRDVVTQAAEIAVNARREGKALSLAAQQLDMAADPMVGVVLDLFARNARTVKPVVEALSSAADLAYTEATKPGEDMFGVVPRASRADVINQLRPQNERASQENLEQPAGREPVQVDAGRAEAQPAAATDPAAAEAGRPAEAEGLTSYTPEEIAQRVERLEQAERERQQQEREAEQRAQADAERDTFALIGSDRTADVAAAQGQTDIFSAPAEPGIDTAKLEKDFRTYPTKILSALIERGDLAKLHKAAGVKSANAFGDMPIDDQAAAYVKFVEQGGRPVEGLPADYNAWVASQERDIEVRRLQSDRVVRQTNGKPFKTEASAKQMQERFDLQGTHEIVAVDGGFELRQLSPSAQAEIKRKSEGRESYTEAQAAVADEMGIGQTPDGEWDATDDQFDEMERRTQARMRGESTQTTTAAKPIEDAGEKIGGARKDRWKERGLNLDDLDSMTEAEGAELATKANVWKPDYEALSQAAEPVTAAMVKTIYDRLAAKPKKNTPEGRRQYVQMMRIVREVYTQAKGPEAVQGAYQEIRKRAGLNTMDPQAKAAARELLFSVYKGRSDPFVLGYNELAKAKKMVADGFPGKAEPWRNRLVISRQQGGPGVTERGMAMYLEDSAELGTPLTREQIEAGFFRVMDKKNKTLAYAPTKEDAEAAAKTIYERDMKGGKDGKPDPERPHLDELKRENLPQRIDRDVTTEDFIRDFGFRGVEFGNWSAQDERQRIINMAYDGLMDLAEIMNVPPKAVSLNGSLGMAFGARGGGRFLAHYEPGKLVINMTKLRGGGSLAHEWAHAMDHYFGELDKPDAYTTQARGASGWMDEDQYNGIPRRRMEQIDGQWKSVEKTRLDNLRPEMARAFDEVMRAIFQRQITKAEMVRSQELDLERTQALAIKEQDADLKAMYQRMAENKRQALEELRQDPEDTMYAGRGRSEYANQAQALSGKSTKGYWTRPTEMFARAFESWVFDKVTAMGARSDYLVHGVEGDRFAGGAYKGNPYPSGEERARINAAFDKLVSTMKTRQTDKGVMLFEPEAQYGETGPFGPVLTQYRGDAQGAIEALKRLQDGEATAALNHPAVGDIDLVWGIEGTRESNGYGLAKLVKWHPEVLDDLQGVISSLKVVERTSNRVQLESPEHKAAVRLEWDGKAKSWLLTAFQKKRAGGDTRTDTAATDGLEGDTARLKPGPASVAAPGFNEYNAEAPRRPYTDDRQLQLFLDNGPDQSQAGPRGEAAQRSAVSAVDDLRSTETILGLALSRDYAARQRVSLVGQKVESAEDLAILAQVYRDPRFETFRVVFVNDAGKVVSQVGLTSRLPASAVAIMGNDMDAYLRDLSATARNRGATKFYMLHNHPSGIAQPSTADLQLTRAFAAKMPDLAFESHVVIDTNEYSTIEGNGSFDTHQKDFGQPAPYRAQEWADVNITGPADVMAMAKRLQVDDGAVTLIHTDNQYKVKAISTIPATAAIGGDARKQVIRASLKMQGAQVFAVSRSGPALLQMESIVRDAIHVKSDGSVESLASKGVFRGGEPISGNRRTRLSPDTSPEFAYLRQGPQREGAQQVAEDGPNYDPRSLQGASETWSVPEPGAGDAFVRAIQNNKIDLKRLRDAIAKQYGQPAVQKDAYLAEELYHGKVAARVEALHKEYVEPILAKIAVASKNVGLTLDDLNLYLHARHAPERNAAMKAINPDMENNEALSGMTDQEASKVMADFEAAGKDKALALIAKDVDQLLADNRAAMVADGLEEAGVIQAWEAAYQHYVPLQRDIKSSGTPKGMGFSVRGPESKRAVGSNRQVVNILANIVAQAEATAIRAEKAKVGRTLLAMARQYPNPDFWKVDIPPTKPRIDKETGLVIRAAVDPLYQTADNVVMVKDYGQDHFIVFNKDSERAMAVAKAMRNLGIEPMGRVLQVVNKGTRFLASLLTQRNPVFWLTNFSRDIQGAMLNLEGTDAEGLQRQVWGNLPQAFKGMHSLVRKQGQGEWARYAREFRDAGGTTGYMQAFENSDRRMDDLRKEVARMQQGKADPRRLARTALEFIDDYNDIIENAVRLSVFQSAREAGVSTAKAASIAKNITVNFNRKGNVTPVVNSLYMFFNASVQGTARLAQAVVTSKKAQAAVGAITMMGFLLDALNRAMADDDEETGRNRYDLIPEFEKSKNWIIMNPMRPGEYVKVPLPLGPHVFHNVGRLVSDAIFRDDPRNLQEYGWAMANTLLDAFSPLGTASSLGQLIAPSVADPVLQLTENKSFTGAPVFKSADRGFGPDDPAPAYTRYFDSTPDVWKAASRMLNDVSGGDDVKAGAINIEPDILKHVFYTMTGGPGRALDQAIDSAQSEARGQETSVNRLPLASRFYGVNDDRQRERVFYDDRKRVADAKAQFDYYNKEGRRDLAREVAEELGDGEYTKGLRMMREFTSANNTIRKLNAQIKRELERQASGEDRSEQLKALRQRRTRTMADTVRDEEAMAE